MKLITEKFMFNSPLGQELYEKYARDLPIVDFHCHLPPKEILADKPFDNITQIWLYGDHYKWRLMRFHGIDEKYITGDGSDEEKFKAYAETIQYALANPLYHWSNLELSKYFGVDEVLTADNWKQVYDRANAHIKEHKLSPSKLINGSNVELVCTTENPYDSLDAHREIAKSQKIRAKVVPGFRPDDLWYAGEKRFSALVSKLSAKFGELINTYDDLLRLLERALVEFKELGSAISDHGFNLLPFCETTLEETEKTFAKAMAGQPVSAQERDAFSTQAITDLACLYVKHGFVMQFHFGAVRNNNAKMFDQLGADTGFDVPNHQGNVVEALNATLNRMYAKHGQTPKIVLFNLDGTFNRAVAAVANNFQVSTGVRGKIQLGAAWWMNDTESGMRDQLTNFAEQSVLGDCVGMLTDSRSFVSYARHDYFRRVLCAWLGEHAMKWHRLPQDLDYLGKVVRAVAHDNAAAFFAR